MKKLTSTLGVFALVAGVAAAFAMSPAPKKITAKAGAGELYWINANGSDGGFMTPTAKQIECGTPTVHCADGYESLDEEGNGVGTAHPLNGIQR